jgi:hypothetical protein
MTPRFHNPESSPPPGGWYYFLDFARPDTRVSGYSPPEVFAQVKTWRQNNGRFTTDAELDAELWAFWCGLQPQRCGQTGPPTSIQPHVVGWADVASFARMAVESLFGGLVEQQEADRRAAICAECPLNQPLGDCPKCRETVGWLREKIAGRSTRLDNRLNACSICGCDLKAAVHVRLDVQQRDLTPAQRLAFRGVANCWKKEGL